MACVRFKQFMEQGEEEKDIQRTLGKIPPSHAALVQGFRWKFHGGNTLDGDDQHIGYMDDRTREIAVAAPWNYGREFTVLHEIGHRVWERLDPALKHEWAQIVAATKHKQNQSPEELHSMAYANHYSKNKIVIHTHPEWEAFIERLPQ